MPASAQDTEPTPTDRDTARERSVDQATARGEHVAHVQRPPTEPAGQLQVFLPVQVGMDAGDEGQPVFIAPNLSWGVTDQFTVRLLHGESWRPPSQVSGVCFGGSGRGCPHVYENVGADALLVVAHADAGSVVLGAGVSLPGLHPARVGLTTSARAELELGERAALELETAALWDPGRRVPRPQEPTPGNDPSHRLGSTLRAQFQAVRRCSVFALVGWFAPLSAFASQGEGPLGAGSLFAATPRLDVGLQLTFTNVLGADASWSSRQLSVLVALRS